MTINGDDPAQQIEQVKSIIKEWIDSRKTGSIQINFFKGGIANLVKKESIKLGGATTKKKACLNDR